MSGKQPQKRSRRKNAGNGRRAISKQEVEKIAVSSMRRLENQLSRKGTMLSKRRGKKGLKGRNSVANQLSMGMSKGIGKTLSEEPSAAAFPRVYMNPFLKLDARMPIWPVRGTLCQYRQATAFGVCNANGVGYVSMYPINMICNDLTMSFVSQITSGDGVNSAPGTPVSCGGAYSAASFTGDDAFSVRIVAFGVRVRYTGTELNKGGFMTMFQFTPRQSCDTLTSTIIQSTQIDWKQYKFDNSWHQYNRALTESDDSLYLKRDPDTFPATPWIYDDFDANAPENFDYMCVCINGAAAGSPFEVQYAGHFEIVGPVNNTTGIRTGTLNTAKFEKSINLQSNLRSKDSTTPDHTGEGGIGKFLSGVGDISHIVGELI